MPSSGVAKTHQSCPICKHKKCLTVFSNGTAWCHSHNVEVDKPFRYNEELINHKPEYTTPPIPTGDNSKYVFGSIADRNISEETARKYGVKLLYDQQGNIIEHMYPYYSENTLTASKIRTVATKNFRWTGTQGEVGLFGENLFKSGGKYLMIVEGELDALSAHQLTGNKWPVVSIPSGANSAVKSVKESLEFVEGFEFVVICFDKDKSGKEASKQLARIIKPGKAKIMNLPNGFKDANDMLKANAHKQFLQSFWDAKVYTPSGVINISELRKKFHNREYKESIPYPWEGLNKKLLGMRQSEMVVHTGGTGLGKSSVTRELEHHLIMNTTDNVGVIALEEDWRRTVDGILSIEANARLYIDQEREKFSTEELDRLFNTLYDGANKDRVWVHAHFGTNSIEEIFSKLRYMIIGCDCKWVVIDHLHMLVSAVHERDERRAIDDIMTRLRSIVEETGAGIILVSHLRRVDGNKGHENGIEVNLSHLRGSNSIGQLSDCVISLERDQQSDDPDEANTTRVRVLKSRYTGNVGLATSLLYDQDTGRLSEVPLHEYEFNNDGNELSI